MNRGFVDGAVASGIRAAHEAIQKCDPFYRFPMGAKFKDTIMPVSETASRNEYYGLYMILILLTSASVATVGGISYLAWDALGTIIDKSINFTLHSLKSLLQKIK